MFNRLSRSMHILTSLSDSVQVQGGFLKSCTDRLEREGLSSECNSVILEHFYCFSNGDVIKSSGHLCMKQILYHLSAILRMNAGKMMLWTQQSVVVFFCFIVFLGGLFLPVIFFGKWPARK